MNSLLASLALLAASPYAAEIQSWRAAREARLKADDGWLTVAGLFWLREGENRFGTDAANAIVLPAGSAPAHAGSFLLRQGKVTLRPSIVQLQVNGKPASEMELRPDDDLVTLGRLTLFVIRRGASLGIRMRDQESRYRREFTGLKWFPVREDYRVKARFEPHATPRTVRIPNVLGDVDDMPTPGRVVFTLGGKEHSLVPVSAGQQLWFIFKDRTSGKETYGAGRFLYADAPKDGQVILDFNKAYNPPCAFTPYATCPLPPKQNWLPARIEAGELDHHPPE